MKENVVPMSEFRYYQLYKPIGIISQHFSDVKRKKTLRDLHVFAEGVQPLGRLDEDSEGLLLLTDDKVFHHHTLHDKSMEKEYWVQVVGVVSEEQRLALEQGVHISVEGVPYSTQPCTVRILQEPLPIPHRIPHMIKHQKKPYTWLSIVLKEGKNRQIRRMTSSVGFPTVRLVRVRINTLWLNDMQPGDILQIPRPW